MLDSVLSGGPLLRCLLGRHNFWRAPFLGARLPVPSRLREAGCHHCQVGPLTISSAVQAISAIHMALSAVAVEMLMSKEICVRLQISATDVAESQAEVD